MTATSSHECFARFGELTEAKVMMERDDPTKSRGFAFVTFANPADAERAASEMNDQELDGRRIRVDLGGGKGGGKGDGGGKGTCFCCFWRPPHIHCCALAGQKGSDGLRGMRPKGDDDMHSRN